MQKRTIKYHQANPKKLKITSLLLSIFLTLFISTIAFAEGGGRYEVDPWSFGLMADTQWTLGEDPENPGFPLDPQGANQEWVSAALAGAIQKELMDNGIKFVIQVGDLTDRAGNAGMEVRATAAQPLLDAGIGFYPLRGNHETYGALYGRDPDHDMNIPAYLTAFPQTQGLGNTNGAENFSSPSDIITGVDILDGLSYSFDYGDPDNNARFVIVDVEATSYSHTVAPVDPDYGQGYFYIWWIVYNSGAYDEYGNEIIAPGTWFRISSSGSPSTNFYGLDSIWAIDDWASSELWDSAGTEFWPGMQQDWISARLDKETRDTEHAFVLSHRGLMGTNHVDCFFGSNPGSKAGLTNHGTSYDITSDQQNPFYASLVENGVRYMLSGHDHLHNRAIVDSPDGEKQVQQIIHMAASTKFYSPGSLDAFDHDVYGDAKLRETQISQDLYNVGYYIYTIDGPRVNVDYYADSDGNFLDGNDYPYGDDSVPARLYMPELDFVKKETYGYSTNGQQFLVAQGESYTVVEDSFEETTAKILAGTNNSTTTDDTPTEIDDNDTPEDPSDDIILSAPRALTKVVNTGWVAKPGNMFGSDIFSLWGIGELGNAASDIYVLEISYTDVRNKGRHKGNGGYRLCSIDENGHWKKAVDFNIGKQKKKFIVGPWNGTMELGTHGIDPTTGKAWAVLNYVADFAVVKGHDK